MDLDYINIIPEELAEIKNLLTTRGLKDEKEYVVRSLAIKDSNFLRIFPRKLLTQDLCLLAVKAFGYAIEYIEESNLTPEICDAALNKDWKVMEHIPKSFQTPGFCLKAVTINGRNLEHVINPTTDLYEPAISSYPMALQFVPEENRTYELCLKAIRGDGRSWMYVPHILRTPELKKIAKNSPLGDYVH